MRRINWFLLLFAAALLTWTALPRYLPEGLRPDLILIVVLFTALSAPPEDALPLSWVAGLVKDVLTTGPLGQYALLYLLLAALLLRLKPLFDTRAALARVLIGAAAHLACEGAGLLIEGMRAGVWPDAAARNLLLLSALVTGILTPLLSRPLDRIAGRLGLERRRLGWVR